MILFFLKWYLAECKIFQKVKFLVLVILFRFNDSLYPPSCKHYFKREISFKKKKTKLNSFMCHPNKVKIPQKSQSLNLERAAPRIFDWLTPGVPRGPVFLSLHLLSSTCPLAVYHPQLLFTDGP